MRHLAPLLAAAVLVAGCGGGPPGQQPSEQQPSEQQPAGQADRDFVAHMLVHHSRALELGTLGEQRGSDARVRAFGARIVREQTPEEQHLSSWSDSLHLAPASGAMAAGYVDDGSLAALQLRTGTAFDRQVLLLSASSEEGAVAMAREELAGGRDAAARQLATAISGAPTEEIPSLRALAAALPG